MTDKQIIIDYKKLCENYSKEVRCYNTFDGSCIKEQCFTYKLLQQLQAKEQECKKLKSQIEIYSNMLESSSNKILKKEEECEELKKQLQGDKGLITSAGKMNYQLLQEYDKLKAVLTEIKEIAENMNKECFYDDFDCKDCDMQNGCTYFNKKQILQKISECEVEK